MRTIVLGFDIERSGAGFEHDTIAIGASVVDQDFKELDSLLLLGYTDDTKFEQRCMDEFWSNHKDVLEKLRYTGNLTHNERQKEMIQEFQEFRKKWETYATENNCVLELVSDNNVYDGGFINRMISDYTGDMLIPYTASTKKYRPFWETHSEQRGLLMVADPSYDNNWGFSKRIREIYEIPQTTKEHDHMPNNDAYVIAHEQQAMLNIRVGNVRLRKRYASRNIGWQMLGLLREIVINLKNFGVQQYQECQSRRNQRNEEKED